MRAHEQLHRRLRVQQWGYSRDKYVIKWKKKKPGNRKEKLGIFEPLIFL